MCVLYLRVGLEKSKKEKEKEAETAGELVEIDPTCHLHLDTNKLK